MNRKKELKQQYQEKEILSGVYQIRNTSNQKIFVTGSMNLNTMNGQKFQLDAGLHRSKKLQEEWRQSGAEAFVFEVLEVLEKKDDEFFDARDALRKLEARWLDQLQPFEERGYNERSKSKE